MSTCESVLCELISLEKKKSADKHVYRNVPIRSALPNRSAHPPSESAHCHGIVAPPQNKSAGCLYTNLMEFIHTWTVKHGTCCWKSQWWPPKPVSLLLTCLNRHMSKHNISAPVMTKMAQNRSTLRDVLAQGASNRDITVYWIQVWITFCTLHSKSLVKSHYDWVTRDSNFFHAQLWFPASDCDF